MPSPPESSGYGYNGRLEAILEEYSFPGTYLDNAAAPLIAKSVATKSAQYMVENPLVNPHSKNYYSIRTSAMIQDTRMKVLKLFNTNPDEYDLVFTANATASLKLVGECMEDFNLMYLTDSHTSVVGLRALAKSYRTTMEIEKHTLDESWIVSWPLQSNFDGTRYPLSWVDDFTKDGAISLVDMSAYCSTSMPDLSRIKPDLAVLSFYKMYGLPDLGALIIRKSAKTRKLFTLRRYAGGGTVDALAPRKYYMVRSSDLITSLEDGTLPFHSIASLSVAIDEFQALYGGFDAISDHTKAVTKYCHKMLSRLKYCRVISPSNHGPVVTFTLSNTGYQEFSNVASKLDIHVRTGTLCNVGAFVVNSDLDDDDIIHNHQVLGKTCSDEQDLIEGKDTGVVRASFGPYSTYGDVDTLVRCVETYFSDIVSKEISRSSKSSVSHLFIYPIKSCAGLQLQESEVLARGLKWDREFCLVHPVSLSVYSLKKHIVMAKIRSFPDTIEGVLKIQFEDQKLSVSLDPRKWPSVSESDGVSICGMKDSDLHVNRDPTVQRYFSSILGNPCTLARIIDEDARHSKSTSSSPDAPLSLSNSSPILLISTTSARYLEDSDYHVFRANVIVKTDHAFDEDDWSQVTIGDGTFDILGPCRRCNMVCVSLDGKSNPAPYLALTKYRRRNGKLWFGQHMQTHSSLNVFNVKVGDIVNCTLARSEPT